MSRIIGEYDIFLLFLRQSVTHEPKKKTTDFNEMLVIALNNYTNIVRLTNYQSFKLMKKKLSTYF